MPNFSGKWTLTEQAQGAAAGTWPLRFDYELYTWGANGSGQLGHNNTISLSSPVQVGALVDWQTVISGSDHRLAIKTDGSLWAWGENNNGQLGINTVVDVSSPVQIGALTNWLSVSAGVSISFAIKTDGSLWSWGKANGGILGNNTTIDLSSPVQVGASTDWYSISLRGENCFGAIKTDGSLWTWGVASYGGLGSNNTTNQSSPVQVGALTTWASVSSANHFMLATKTDGTLWAWGKNSRGELGQNDRVYRSSPVQIGALTNWASVSAGSETAGAVKTDGTLWGWGSNSDGNLGDGTKYNYRSSPVQIGALTTWSQVSTTVSGGFRATIGLKTDGTIWTWGNNASGCLGTSAGSVIVVSPVQVGASTNWGAVSFGTRTATATIKA